jgi:hypothetical protein
MNKMKSKTALRKSFRVLIAPMPLSEGKYPKTKRKPLQKKEAPKSS